MSESPAAAAPASDDERPEVPPANEGDVDMGDGNISDDVSELSDVNEDEFENFDVNAINIEEADLDQDALKEVKVRKRERKPGEEPKKKRKESRRDKQQAKKAKKRGGDDDELDGDAADAEGGRRRRRTAGEGAERKKKVRAETPEEQLSEGERTRRDMEKKVAAIIKRPTVRRKKLAGDDLSNFMDEEINILRNEMAAAAKADNDARTAVPPKPAMHKLKLLPKVVALLSRNGREAENAIVDPDNNLMEAVRFFLEPLGDGSLPAHDIQQKMFDALLRLPINKETLIASGIGRVILFYTKSKKPEPNIKRAAEKCLAEWTRPILKRTDDYRARDLQEVEYDPSIGGGQAPGSSQDPGAMAMAKARAARAKALERPNPGNRARLEKVEQKTYTIVPKSNLSHLQKRRRD